MVELDGVPVTDLAEALALARDQSLVELSGPVDAVDDPIPVTENVTIRGGEIVGGLAESVFEVAAGKTLVLEQTAFTLAGGRAVSASQSSLVLTDVDITGGVADQGGHLRVVEGSLDVSGGTFRTGEAESGGSVWTVDSDVEIHGARFEENVALSTNGGALRVAVSLVASTLVVGETTFADNRAESDHGGALHLSGDLGATLTGCTFERNEAGLSGGAVRATDRVVVTAIGGSFTENQAHDGGAVLVSERAQATLQDVAFSTNTALGDGGHLAVRDATVDVVGGTFHLGHANRGGAFSAVGGELDLTGCRLDDPEADTLGGAIFQDGAISTLTDLVVDGSRAGTQGGLLRLEGAGARATLARVTACDPVAHREGGALSVQATELSGANVLVMGAIAGRDGGAVRVDQGGVASFVNTTFRDGAAASGGGSRADSGSSVDLTDSLLVDNAPDAVSQGGGSTTTLVGVGIWPTQLPLPGSVTRPIPLIDTPFAPRPVACEPLASVPEWTSELVSSTPPDRASFPGSVGGPGAADEWWEDADGDTVPALWDCDDHDPAVFPDALGICTPAEPGDTGVETDTDTDADSDSDTDADTDADADADADADTDADTADPDPDQVGKLGASALGDRGCGCATGSRPPHLGRDALPNPPPGIALLALLALRRRQAQRSTFAAMRA